jgi:hypothetical protein
MMDNGSKQQQQQQPYVRPPRPQSSEDRELPEPPPPPPPPAEARVVAAPIERFALPRRISGPVSVHGFFPTPPNPHFIIFGDAHFSTRNTCMECRGPPECEHITRLLSRFVADAEATRRSLDVHIELAYVSKDMTDRAEVMKTLRSSTIRDAIDLQLQESDEGGVPSSTRDAAAAATERTLLRIDFLRRVGMIGQLYRKFESYLYDDSRKSNPSNNVRFHYSDIRFDPNIASFHQELSDAHDVHTVLTALFFGEYNIGKWRGIDGDVAEDKKELPFLLHRDSLTRYQHAGSSRLIHKVTKQYLKLLELDSRMRPRKDAHSLKVSRIVSSATSYIQDRIAELRDAISLQQQLQDESASSDRIILFYKSVTFLVLDAYVLFRSLYFYLNDPEGITVIYAGSMHAETMVAFFLKYLHEMPTICHTFQEISEKDYKRCVATDSYDGKCVPVSTSATAKITVAQNAEASAEAGAA